MRENREPRVNSHVSRLGRYLPFHASHDQIYEEYQTEEDSLSLETVALEYALGAIEAGARCLVFTGDAGHGKTHLCRRLLEKVLGHDSARSRQLLLEGCNGQSVLAPASDAAGARLRIHKDLSEMQPPSRAAEFLEGSALTAGQTLVVCANEGRLRAIVSSSRAGAVCDSLRELFQSSFDTGVCATDDGHLHIVNLNYQSVAAPTETRQSLLRRTLASWVNDRRRWGDRGCGSCASEHVCPIRRNKALLADEAEESAGRVRRLEELFQAVERLGHVITIREMLMLAAYLITGGLSCADVHRRASAASREAGWQHPYIYYNLLFRPPPDAPEDRIYKGIPVLSVFRLLDPGTLASRSIDERLLNEGDVFDEGQLDLAFRLPVGGQERVVDAALGIDELMGTAQTRADLARETEVTAHVVASLRRRSFFDMAGSDGSMMARLGFRYGDEFLRMLSGAMPARELVQLKSRLVAGLHAIQGLRMGRSETSLHLVDPAFGKASADAAIIARRIPTSRIILLRARDAWSERHLQWTLPASVDWIDRSVIMRFDDGDTHRDLSLDLLTFECIARSSSGYVSEAFYALAMRRIRTFLGQMAEQAHDADRSQISLFMGGRIHNVSIDMDVIQVGGH